MDSNEYTGNLENNQGNPYGYYVSINNNLPTMANNNLIDLSNHASQAYDLSMPQERAHNEPRNNNVIRTKGAQKIIIDRKGASYQAEPSKAGASVSTDGGNFALEACSGQVATLSDMSAMFRDVSYVRHNEDRNQIKRLAIFEDISSVESQNDDDNDSRGDEADRNYSALDDSTMSKIQECSSLNKAIIRILLRNLTIIMLHPTSEKTVNTTRGRCYLDSKGLQILIHCVMEIIAIAPFYMTRHVSDKCTQTVNDYFDPPIANNKSTQTVAETNTKTSSTKARRNREASKERYFHNVQATNQNTNVYNNQQEQFYDNQQCFSQIPIDQSYVMQTQERNRNNIQMPMMQYGMPNTANVMMQRPEPVNNELRAMQAMTQYGIPHTQTSSTMMQYAQRPDCGMSGMQMPHPVIPQQNPAIIQRADICRNMMQSMMQPRPYLPANVTATAAVPPTTAYYNRRKSATVPRQEVQREIPLTQPVVQTVTQATLPSTSRGRRPRGYYAPPNIPYPQCAQWQMPNYQDQFHNN